MIGIRTNADFSLISILSSFSKFEYLYTIAQSMFSLEWAIFAVKALSYRYV